MENDRTLTLGRLEDLASGEMREVEVQGKKILLVRHADGVTAMGAECPHAGASLAEGILTENQVICPWHKAAFCARSGTRLEPPAVDDLPLYSIEIENGDILLRGIVPSASPPQSAEDPRRFVILGAGAAGFSAAQELRRIGFAGKVTLISQETELPYDRTILSKYVLAGQQAGEKSPLQEEDFFVINKIERITGEIAFLDPQRQRIELSNGKNLPYDKALIATGGKIEEPPFPGGKLKNVFTLRSRRDADQIIAVAAKGKRAVVIGASFIGMEAAAALRERGLDVTVVGTESAPFEKQLGPQIGNVYRKIHQEKGVKFRLGTEVERISGENVATAVVLKNGETLAADLVIAGIGVKPATEFAKTLTPGPEQAFAVDAQMRVSPNLYAAGDVAAFPIYGTGPQIRVEHWRVAEQQGIIAARNMAGKKTNFTAAPYFWTIQYMIRLDYVGHASGKDEQIIRGDLDAEKFIVYYLRNGIVAAAAGMNQDLKMAALIRLINKHQNWTVDDLDQAVAGFEK